MPYDTMAALRGKSRRLGSPFSLYARALRKQHIVLFRVWWENVHFAQNDLRVIFIFEMLAVLSHAMDQTCQRFRFKIEY